MRTLAQLREEVSRGRALEDQVASLEGLLELAIEEKDESLKDSFQEEIADLAAKVEKLEWKLALSGPYDQRNAILAVHAGAGGTDAQDWVEMLVRMYVRWAEKMGFSAKVVDTSPGEEAGLKSATVEVQGHYAYGYLKAEKGVHRLVRLSRFDAAHLRHTSFALAEVLPEVEEELEVALREEELRVDTFRASGHGGQNVQKTSTAVRIVHLPTGITVGCQSERSQRQNKEIALRILKARLMDRELQRRAQEQEHLKGQHVPAEWGNQIRSYVLHPYKLVKDHRTGFETSDPQAVLDGYLDELLEAYIRWGEGSGR